MKLGILKHPASQIGIAAVAGVVFGLIAGEWAGNLEFLGQIFIRLIPMAIVPLVMASVIVATGSMGGVGTGRLAARTFAWMIGFSIVAASLAVALSVLLQPGAGATFEGELDPALEQSATEAVGWQDTVLGFFSTNIVASMSTATMVPIIVFSLLFGVALNSYVASTGSRLVLQGLEQLQQILLVLIRLVMRIAPIGVFALLASLTGEVGLAVVTTALAYLGTTALGVLILTVVFVAVVALRTRLDPRRLPRKLAEQTVIAVTTTSSAVTYPTVLRNTVERIGVSERVANFTLSIGLTMGSYGAVLNYTIVVFFLAQAGNVTLSPAQVLLGMGLAILLNMGTITVPGGFPVVALFLASTLGLPVQAVGLLIAVDWFTGIFRTFLNVNGDTFVAMLVANADDEIDRDAYNGTRAPVEAAHNVG
ncbi:dicarboxylate/amino acid:cation symporter [Rathayibacter sp. VKM Ac-2754]|uniref:dicarboxylate/amino acid:cation symporter n=1 Tax=Rathayibacter sp. VKM Ac-2754 TaxID=2609251 RepID=UPI00194E7218|nr:dicarboxylate/amino acid:cation symporter [Rathayibacter sp. VKM Ac-2754]